MPKRIVLWAMHTFIYPGSFIPQTDWNIIVWNYFVLMFLTICRVQFIMQMKLLCCKLKKCLTIFENVKLYTGSLYRNISQGGLRCIVKYTIKNRMTILNWYIYDYLKINSSYIHYCWLFWRNGGINIWENHHNDSKWKWIKLSK
jgi:hypothetical protein